MRTYFNIIVLFMLAVSQAEARQTPHISGTVNIVMSQGLIQCDFNLSRLPDLGRQYQILLYRGFNIKFLKGDSGRVLNYEGYYGGKLNGEGVAYVPRIKNDTLALPKKLSLSYTGAFPVYTDTLNSFDFKGLIAFNGKTLRAAEQSKWYPVLYDTRNDKELSDVTYDITVNCSDCKSVYINGSAAQKGPSARFSSEVPRQLLLFAGNYEVQPLSSSTFLNAELNTEEAKVFNGNITTIRDFYQQYLKTPYGEKITFLQHTAVEPFDPKHSWGFVTFPTIAVAGKPFKSNVDIQTGLFKDTISYRFFAHEMGHYYFGQLVRANSGLRWFFLESTAEFLSVKATQAKYGRIATQQYIDARRSMMNNRELIPLPQIWNPEDIGERYRYNYGPLILLAMEKRFGEKTVQLLLQKMLQRTGQSTDYAFFLSAVKDAGISDKDWKLFEAAVINQKECKHIFTYL